MNMAGIELVIKLPEEKWEVIQKRMYCNIFDLNMWNAIKNGTPLPKGHGRLIDADAVLAEPIGNTYKDIDIAETIIEADETESEEKE